MTETSLYLDHLAGRELRQAQYLAALSDYRRLTGEFAERLEREGVADVRELREAEQELARWQEATQHDRMRPSREVAKQLGLSRSSLRRWCQRGQILSEKRGSIWYILPEDVERLIAEGEIAPKDRKAPG